MQPGKFFDSEKTLGDIDILLIDRNLFRIFLVETKDLNFGRTPAEISSELNKLIRGKPDKGTEKTYCQLHLNRFDWILSNPEKVRIKLSLSKNRWKVIPMMLTNEALPSVLYLDPPLDIHSFHDLKMDSGKLLKTLSESKFTKFIES